MKVSIPDGGTILIGGILDDVGGIFQLLLVILQVLAGLLLPAVQSARPRG